MSLTRDNIIEWLTAYAQVIAENSSYLTQLDSAIGDADHGINMNRGFQAVLRKLAGAGSQDIGAILKMVGMTLLSTVGGAGGPLYGTLFIQAANATAGKMELSLAEWTAALEAGVNGVIQRGKAAPGDKTLVDALLPAVQALKSAALQEPALEAQNQNQALAGALRQSAQAAEQGMKATIPLVARKGRASYLGERSAGHQDPGATSSFLLVETLWKVMSNE